MKKIKNVFLLGLLMFSLTSCISIQSVSISDVKPSTGFKVDASAGAIGFLHLGVPKDLAVKAANDLKSKGAVDNISTVLTMREWGIVQYYKIVATGTSAPK